MAAEDVFADAVLDGITAEDAVSTVIREGRPRWWGGLDALSSGIAARRALLDTDAAVQADMLADTMADTMADPVDEAVRVEYRTLFSDPDDLARLEEAELLGLPDSIPAKYQALADRTWRSTKAGQLFAAADDAVRSIHHAVIERAVSRLANLDTGAEQAMARALDLLCAVASESHNPNRDWDIHEMELLEPLFLRLPSKVTTGPVAMFHELRWRRSAQDRLVAALDPTTQRRFTIAWHNVAGSSTELRRAVRQWHQVSSPDQLSNPLYLGDPRSAAPAGAAGSARSWHPDSTGDPDLGAYLFAAVVDPVAEAADLDLLERSIGQDYPGAGLDDIDAEAIERTLGRPARQQLEELRRAVHAVTVLRSEAGGQLRRTVDLVAIRRRVPAMALRRGLTPRLRRQLGGPPTVTPRLGVHELGEQTAVVVLVDRAGVADGCWAGIRSGALAVAELVRRYHPGQACSLAVTQPDGSVRTVTVPELVELADPTDEHTAAEPQRVMGALRRSGARAERAVLLVLGNPDLGAGLARIGSRLGWTVRSVPRGETRVTAVITQTLAALTR